MEFIKSIFSIKVYKDFAKQSFGKSLLYYFLLTTILFILGAVILFSKFNNFTEKYIREALKELPDFKIEAGILSINLKQPYKLGEIIIDTSIEGDVTEFGNERINELLGRDSIYIKNEGNEKIIRITYSSILERFNLEDLDNTVLENKASSIANYFRNIFIVIYIFSYIPTLFIKFIPVLVLSLFALIVNKVKKTNLSYASLINICIHALTLPWIVKLVYYSLFVNLVTDVIFKWLGIHFVYWIIYWAVSALYAYQAINYIKKTESEDSLELTV